MPVPVSYDEASFRAFLHHEVELAHLAGVIGWEGSDPHYTEILTDVLLALGVESIVSVTGANPIAQLRAAGRVVLWKRVRQALTTAYNFSNANGSFSRGAMLEAVTQLLASAESEAASCGATGVLPSQPPAVVSSLGYPQDPYGPGMRSTPWLRRRPR